MYRGFKLKIEDIDNVDFFKSRLKRNYYIKEGENLFNSYQDEIKYKLDSFILEDGTIDGSKMQENWFPQIDADVFISHSHDDEMIAKALAGWLSEVFGIKSFIDSCVWGYAGKLLEIIDKDKCRKTDGYYDYHKRNRSTSIVHMMLSTALTMMIDNTESILLLNTNNAINTSLAIKETTSSPWLYSEITISKLIQKKEPKRHYRRTMLFSKSVLDSLNESIVPRFNVDTEHLSPINETTLNGWEDEWQSIKNNYQYPLDALYHIVPPKKIKSFI